MKTISVRQYFMEPMGDMKKNSVIIRSDKKLKKGGI